ncbi:MAG: ComF family protein [Deltaproteobacteria bacterium]|nr:ComF family protein [Deltaproteobacteria bacterium]MBW2308076.1 ComF family protein [Deltaproteobacteria bacterium]
MGFVFPPRCLCCGDFVRDGPWFFICRDCRLKINTIPFPACIPCGSPMEKGVRAESCCARCRSGVWNFGKAIAVGTYDGPMAELIRQFKFRGRTEVSAFGGQLMASSLQKETAPGSYDLLVPVPLHIRRLRQRGFNQSLLLAREMERIIGIAVAPLALRRHRWTNPQPGLDEKSRRENVLGAFETPEPSRIRDRRVLIIDDVLTTGHTVNECAATLLANGVRTVDVVTLARVA